MSRTVSDVRFPTIGAHRHERGSSLVEFALIFILLMIILLGIMSFSHALYAYHFVDHAAKSATRWAVVNGSACSNDGSCNGTGGMNNGPVTTSAPVQTYVQALAPAGIIAANVTATASWPVQTNSPTVCTTTPQSPGCTVQITVSYPFQFDFPLIDAMVPAATATTAPCTAPGICMQTTSQMVIVH
jgi:Flp pilus assembly protein TadG